MRSASRSVFVTTAEVERLSITGETRLRVENILRSPEVHKISDKNNLGHQEIYSEVWRMTEVLAVLSLPLWVHCCCEVTENNHFSIASLSVCFDVHN